MEPLKTLGATNSFNTIAIYHQYNLSLRRLLTRTCGKVTLAALRWSPRFPYVTHSAPEVLRTGLQLSRSRNFSILLCYKVVHK